MVLLRRVGNLYRKRQDVLKREIQKEVTILFRVAVTSLIVPPCKYLISITIHINNHTIHILNLDLQESIIIDPSLPLKLQSLSKKKQVNISKITIQIPMILNLLLKHNLMLSTKYSSNNRLNSIRISNKIVRSVIE